VLGLCWRTALDDAARRLGPGLALQGNLDPHALFAEPAEVRRLAGDVLARMQGRPGHIMNLGHGILPDTPIASVEALVDAVRATAAQPAEAAEV
jgi:uroporphyrinogen decarboxylase